jgi:putative FmdB family regulatory protein
MPTYDYRCKSCDHTWELFQPITAKPVQECPECGKATANRIIGPGAGIIFKGSGFYQTDYRSESYKKGAEAAKKSEEKASGKSDGGSDAKAAPASKTKSDD